MNKDIDKELQQAKTPKADFSAHRETLKEAIMNDYNQRYVEENVKTKKRGWMLGLSGSLAILAVIAVFAFTTLVSGPLTAQKVLAEAQSSQSAAQEQGRYHYSKTIFTDSFNGERHSFTTELWEDTETSNHRLVTTDANGDVVNEIVYVDGKLYASPFDETSVASQFGAVSEIESGIELDESEIIEIIGTPSADSDISVGHSTITSTTGSVEIVDIDPGDFEEGEIIAMDSGIVMVEQADSFYSALDEIMRSSTTKDRAALFGALLEEDGAELIAEADWHGRQVVGINHSEFDGFSSTMYFDADSYEYVGSESSSSEGFGFEERVLVSTYSDEAVGFSTEGLEELN